MAHPGKVIPKALRRTIYVGGAAATFTYARGEMIIGHRLPRKISPTRAVPEYALLVAAAVPALIAVGSLISTDALTKIVSLAILGIHAAFRMVVLAALRARGKGWKPSGEYRLGRWGPLGNVGALAYGIFAIVNISWPRTPGVPW